MPEENASLGRGIGNAGRLAHADRTIRWQASERISPGPGREFSSGNAHAGNPHADRESDGGHGAGGASTSSESRDRRTNTTERNGVCSGMRGRNGQQRSGVRFRATAAHQSPSSQSSHGAHPTRAVLKAICGRATSGGTAIVEHPARNTEPNP